VGGVFCKLTAHGGAVVGSALLRADSTRIAPPACHPQILREVVGGAQKYSWCSPPSTELAHTAAPLFAFLEREGLEYVIAMGKNKVLERRAARLMGNARRLSRESGETAHLYSETRYAAGTWDQRRRVIIKAEVVRHPRREPKDNPRFVVTNLRHSPRHLYEAIYCARGDIENRVKELHHGLEIDRTSCSRFLANQLRGLLSAAAYVLYQELRLRAARTAF
jgi:Transposase DDE domain group 1